MPLDSGLPDRLLDTYTSCIRSKDVLYYPSEVTKEQNELKTEIRLCESLSKKPGPSPQQLKSVLSKSKGGTPSGNNSSDGNDKSKGVVADALEEKLKEAEEQQKGKQKKDVFDPKHWDQLLVDQFDGGMGEKYGVLLNKYAVVPLHFLIVTKHWEHQTSPLTPPQLLASYQLISLFANTSPHSTSFSSSSETEGKPGTSTNPLVGGDLLCFFNCGEASGASQEHKHIQFAPMSGEGSIGHFPTERAAEAHSLGDNDKDKPFSLEELPYAHYIRRLDPPSLPSPSSSNNKPDMDKLLPTMMYLQQAYLSLLDAMVDNLRLLHDADPESVPIERTKLGKGLSYNLLMTRKYMHLIPRREPVFEIATAEEDDVERKSTKLSPPVDTSGEGAAPSGDRGKVATEPVIIGCNALAFTGTVLVKSATDAKRLASQGGVLTALKHCGYAKATSSIVDINDESGRLA